MALRYLRIGYRLSILFVASAMPVDAQQPPRQDSPLLRVTTDDSRMMVGTLIAWDRELLVLDVLEPDRLRESGLRLRPDRIVRLEVSRGSRTRAGSPELLISVVSGSPRAPAWEGCSGR